MAAYCTVSDVATAAGKYQTLSTAETTAATAAILQASAIIEKATGTFFDQRHLQVTTEAVQARQTKIFMPAPIISIDGNVITEAGFSLTLNTDFLLYQPSVVGIPAGPGWLEKTATPAGGWGDTPGNSIWSTQQKAIVVPGQFGYAAVPYDITKLVAWKAAEILGWVTIDYTDGDGVSKAVLRNGLPKWAESILASRALSYMDEQYFEISVLA